MPGGAEAALDGAVGDESFLQWVQRFEILALFLLVVGAQGTQTLYGKDRLAIYLGRARQARTGGDAVDQNGADIAASFAAANFSAG